MPSDVTRGGAPANIVILSLSNLRGVSSEAVNAGERVQVNLATGAVGSNVQLLPLQETFDPVTAQGRQLFLDETFEGNGRTCGRCHVETNSFTVDPELIATLPPTDPLFVAETNPALAALENPDLLRRFGLILVNADGFDPSRGPVPPLFPRASGGPQHRIVHPPAW